MLRCPSCGSPEIFPVAGGYIGQVYICHVCKYRGSFVVEVDDDDKPEREGD